MPLAALHDVSMTFGDVRALEGVGFTVERGEVLGLIGPNGAGKTTAVRILCGLLEPTEGSAEIEGHDVIRAPLEARRAYGFVPDGAPLYAGLTPVQHLQLVGRLHDMPEDELRSEAMRLLEAFDLHERADQPVGEFSHGMRQKTALACALLPKPPLLILDEPLSGLDAPTAATVKEVLRAWADTRGAVLYTSHLLDIVERVCDRVAILDRGRLAAIGDLKSLRARAGHDGTLEQLFGEVTRSESPVVRARRILGVAESPRESVD